MTSAQTQLLEQHAPTRVLQPTELVQYVALLAGLGNRAGALVDQVASICAQQANADGRTCIDAGSSLIFSMFAPGARSLRALVRQGPTVAGTTPWLRVNQVGQGQFAYLHGETYIGEPPTAWQRASAIAKQVGGMQRFQQAHALLGTHGRIYSTSWSVDPSAPYASVSWQLDRTTAPAQVLMALGLPNAWPMVCTHLQELFGQPPGTSGPWSIQQTFHSDSSCIRIGTTRWARVIEHAAKRRRLSMLVEQFGGDACFAEALYKLIESAAPHTLGSRIGRAVELELVGDQVSGIEFFLCLP